MEPEPESRELRSSPERAGMKAERSASARRISPTTARGKAYTAKPEFGETIPVPPSKKPRARWLAIFLLAAAIAASGLLLKPNAFPPWMHPWTTIQQQEQVLELAPADIDYAATDAARAALQRGEIPASLASVDAATRQKILSGEDKMYTKQLVDNQQQGILVHARVSTGGMLLGEDLLTAEHPRGTTFPAGPGATTQFHFTVEKAGPNGVVTCYVNSISGSAVTTRPLAVGESADLQVIAR